MIDFPVNFLPTAEEMKAKKDGTKKGAEFVGPRVNRNLSLNMRFVLLILKIFAARARIPPRCAAGAFACAGLPSFVGQLVKLRPGCQPGPPPQGGSSTAGLIAARRNVLLTLRILAARQGFRLWSRRFRLLAGPQGPVCSGLRLRCYVGQPFRAAAGLLPGVPLRPKTCGYRSKFGCSPALRPPNASPAAAQKPCPTAHRRAGALSIQFLIIMVPVLLGMMGFAVDLGRIYLIRGELNQAASAMALAAASKLNGTVAATTNATTAAQATLDNSLADANAYNFGSLVVGQGNALLESVVQSPAFFQNLSDAQASLGQTGVTGSADGTTAHHVAINLTADAPLLFWALLSLGQSRKTTLAAAAIAGISAPVCTGCGIEPFAVAAVNPTDPVDFGFVQGTMYTHGSFCTAAAPALLPGTTGTVVPYLIIDRYNTSLPFTRISSCFRMGANGLIPSTTPSQSCSIIGTTEKSGLALPVGTCSAAAPNMSVEAAMCGLSSRLTDPTQITACTTAVSDITDSRRLTPPTPIRSPKPITRLIRATIAGDDSACRKRPFHHGGDDAGSGISAVFAGAYDDFNGCAAGQHSYGWRRAFRGHVYRFCGPGEAGQYQRNRVNISCGIQNGPGKVVLHQ